MEHRQDIYWTESVLSERVDEKVGKYLRKNHPEYQKIKKQIKEMMQQHPNVRAVFETDEAVSVTNGFRTSFVSQGASGSGIRITGDISK